MQYAPTVGYVRPFKKLSRFRLLRGRLWGVCDTPLRPGMCDPSKYRCDPPTGYVRGFKKWICIRHRRWRIVGRMRYAPTTGYVLPFEKLSRFRLLRGRLWGVFDTPLRPGMCGPSKNYPVFVPFGAVGWAYSIRPYNRIRAALQKTVPFSSPSGPLVGRMQYAPMTGYVRSFEIPMKFSNRVRARVQKTDLYTPPSVAYGGAYAIRPYNRVRVILRNTDTIPQLGTCCPSKKLSRFCPLRGRLWGVFNTPLQLGTCDPMKY